jgi:hyaluronan synthase
LADSDKPEKLISQYKVANNDIKDYSQNITVDGKWHIKRKFWIIRIIMILAISYFTIYRLFEGIKFYDPFIIYSTIMPAMTVLTLVGSWYLYRNPSKGNIDEKSLVSVIIPIYNQRNMIEIVIDAVYNSVYKNIEVIAVNDGSVDGTKEILDGLLDKYTTLKVIHKKRGGKRTAISTGFYASRGQFLVHLDSDSVIDKYAITEFVKAFGANPKLGSSVGEIRIWNSNKSTLTKLQDAWHNVSCNVNKAYESAFGSVTCCSGALSAFRREAVSNLMPYWANRDSFSGGGDDRELTAYVIVPKAVKNSFLQALWPSSKYRQKLLSSVASYDDSDDRLLTAHSLTKWESAYVVTAFAYIEAQERWKGFIKQQTRWKKGVLRTNFYLTTYFWRGRHPLASLVYYLDVTSGLTTPFVIMTILLHEPLLVGHYWSLIAFVQGIIFGALAYGIDIKIRYPQSKTWKYMPLVNLLGTFVLSWLLFGALWNFKKNSWMTR